MYLDELTNHQQQTRQILLDLTLKGWKDNSLITDHAGGISSDFIVSVWRETKNNYLQLDYAAPSDAILFVLQASMAAEDQSLRFTFLVDDKLKAILDVIIQYQDDINLAESSKVDEFLAVIQNLTAITTQ